MNSTDATPETSTLQDVEQDRIVVLSDGVFAIAITLLIFNVRVPDGVNVTDVQAIVYSLLPHFIGYTISFIVIASYWLGHRYTMKAITHVDRNFLWLNFLFLFFITLFPVPTELLGLHFGTAAPTIIYACFSAATGFALWLLWMYASGKARLLRPQFDSHEVRFRSTFYLMRSLIYLVSLCILFVPYGVYLFFAIWALLVPLLITILRKVFLPRIRARKKAVH
jgi:uncharacterized membrane protein